MTLIVCMESLNAEQPLLATKRTALIPMLTASCFALFTCRSFLCLVTHPVGGPKDNTSIDRNLLFTRRRFTGALHTRENWFPIPPLWRDDARAGRWCQAELDARFLAVLAAKGSKPAARRGTCAKTELIRICFPHAVLSFGYNR